MSSKQFRMLAERSDLHKEDKDCTVKCLALMLGTSYEDAWNKCKSWGREPRKGFNIMKHFPELEGLTITRVACRAKSVKAFQALSWAGRYAIHTSSHILYYENGTVHDWSKDRQLHIVAVYKINGEASPSFINPACDTLNHCYFSRTTLAKKKRTRTSSACWELYNVTTDQRLATYKRKPTAKIKSLVRGYLTLRSDPSVRLGIRSLSGSEFYEAPEKKNKITLAGW